MRVWQVTEPTGPGGLALVDRPDPSLGPNDVLIRVRAVSLNYRDLLVITGRYQRRTPAGTVPCSDAAGEVLAIGADVTQHRVGDRVTSTFAPGWISGSLTLDAARSALGTGHAAGTLVESLALPAPAVMPVPSSWSFEQAATLPCAALTAWHALFEEAPFHRGMSVLTLGTGGVSMFAAQLALAAGARVISTTGRDVGAQRLTEIGVTDVINYKDVPLWGERARDLAGGKGVDQVIEVGGQGTLEQSIRAVRVGGTISLIGTLAGRVSVDLTPVLMRNIRLQGVMVGSREMFARLLRFLEAVPVTPVIDRVWAFEEAPLAFAHLATATHVGKIVIRV